jgi:flagellar biosynthetic protein FliO
MLEPEIINTGIKTAAMLCIVLGVLVLLLYVMKRFMSPRGKYKGDLLIKTISSLYLSPKERIEVIEISGEKIVIGVTPGKINFLTKLHHNKTFDSKDYTGKDNDIG